MLICVVQGRDSWDGFVVGWVCRGVGLSGVGLSVYPKLYLYPSNGFFYGEYVLVYIYLILALVPSQYHSSAQATQTLYKKTFANRMENV